MATRVTSLDDGYQTGDLSVFPEAIDTKDTLYEVKNNAATTLKQALTINGTYLVVEDASAFPPTGIIRIGPSGATVNANEPSPDLNYSGVPTTTGNSELIYYGERTSTVFKKLQRGFVGTKQTQWSQGTAVSNSVCAEAHNAVKDAVINIQNYLGTSVQPTETSINGIIKNLENKFLAPEANFRAFPKRGQPPLVVNFQNFSGGHIIRHLWDFGDGTTSTERNPIHTYQTEGDYTISLNVISTEGAQGVSTKNNYIHVDESEIDPFFYVAQTNPSQPAYSLETATELSTSPATFQFVDQTDGNISQRFWSFGDGETETQLDPNVHSTTHVYDSPGSYEPTCIIVFADETYKRAILTEELTIL
jgi:PKD repeat protein